MAELSIRRQSTNRDNVATRVKKSIMSAQEEKLRLQKEQSKLKKRPGEDLLAFPNAEVDLKKKTISGLNTKLGSVSDAVNLANANGPKNANDQKSPEAISPAAAATLPKGIVDEISKNKIATPEVRPETISDRETAKQSVYRDNAREQVTQALDGNKTGEMYEQENKFQEQKNIIKNKLASYGDISDDDAGKILKNRIEGTSTWNQKLLDFSLEILLILYSFISGAILMILGFASTAGSVVTAGLSNLATAPALLIAGIANALFIFILSQTIQIGLFIYNKSKSTRTLTNIESIDSLKKIIRKKYKSNMLGFGILRFTNGIIQLTISILPYIGPFIAAIIRILNLIISQYAFWSFERWRKRLLKTIKQAKKEAEG